MKVELINVFGDDNMVCDCARVSYNKLSKEYSEESNEKLINYLAKHNHWSPFSHPKLQFRLEIPIYVERQLVKTEVGREYNSISGRYVDFSDTYTLIEQFRTQSKDSKQGSADNLSKDANDIAVMIQNNIIGYCKNAYSDLIDLGVAKEQARTVLPLSLNTTMIWTGSLFAFIRLYKQRTKPDAQKEINDLLVLMKTEVDKKQLFTKSFKAYDI